jgi:hypothetical protein
MAEPQESPAPRRKSGHRHGSAAVNERPQGVLGGLILNGNCPCLKMLLLQNLYNMI